MEKQLESSTGKKHVKEDFKNSSGSTFVPAMASVTRLVMNGAISQRRVKHLIMLRSSADIQKNVKSSASRRQ